MTRSHCTGCGDRHTLYIDADGDHWCHVCLAGEHVTLGTN